MSAHQLAKNMGNELEEKIHLAFNGYGIKCLREGAITKIYDGVTGIDHMFLYGGKVIFIQDKWEKKKPKTKDINHFASEIMLVKKVIKEPYIGIFVSKSEHSISGSQKLKQHGLFDVHNDDMGNVIAHLKSLVFDFFGINDNGQLDITGDILMLKDLEEKNRSCLDMFKIALSSWCLSHVNWSNTSTQCKQMIECLDEPKLQLRKIYKQFYHIIMTYGPTFNAFEMYELYHNVMGCILPNIAEINRLKGNEFKLEEPKSISQKYIDRATIFASEIMNKYVATHWEIISKLSKQEMIKLKEINPDESYIHITPDQLLLHHTMHKYNNEETKRSTPWETKSSSLWVPTSAVWSSTSLHPSNDNSLDLVDMDLREDEYIGEIKECGTGTNSWPLGKPLSNNVLHGVSTLTKEDMALGANTPGWPLSSITTLDWS